MSLYDQASQEVAQRAATQRTKEQLAPPSASTRPIPPGNPAAGQTDLGQPDAGGGVTAAPAAAPAIPPVGVPGAAADDSATGSYSDALHSVLAHIPTETVAGYVAVLALIPASDRWTELVVFAFFLIATPALMWSLVARQSATNGMGVPSNPQHWPWRRMISSTVAFTGWAAVLPNSVLTYFQGFQSYMGLVAIVLLYVVFAITDPITPRSHPAGAAS